MWREPAEQLPQTMISSNVLPAMLISHSKPVWGERVEKPSQWATGFSIFWRIQEKTKAKPFQALSFRCYTKSIITAHAPGPHIWPSLGPGPDSKCSKTWNSVKSYLTARDRHWWNSRNWHADLPWNSSKARVSIVCLNAAQNGRGLQRVSAPFWDWTHVARLQVTEARLKLLLTTKP